MPLPAEMAEAKQAIDEPAADFGGYKNRHLTSETNNSEEVEKRRAEEAEEEKKKIYTLEQMMALRSENKTRPVNMALLDFPHKKRKGEFRREPISEMDKFSQSVGNIRILLNKLSEGNFDII